MTVHSHTSRLVPHQNPTLQEIIDPNFDSLSGLPSSIMAGSCANPYALYEPPLEFVDHQHQRLHQHNTFLGMMTRRKPDQKTCPNHPDVDISDTITCYLIELEVPGIKDADAIALNWTSFRSLVVAGSTFRYWESNTSTIPNMANNGEKTRDAGNGVDLESEALKDPQKQSENVKDEWSPYLVVSERRIGSFRREFYFPVDIDVGKVEARLEAGLLCIKVPRKPHLDLNGAGKVRVQGMD
jgi:HSP20 family molecular chaperone IbpA